MDRVFTVSIFWIAACLAYATDLCGPADQKVCLRNSLILNLSSSSVLNTGTTLVLLLPGVDVDDALRAIGTPEPKYRFTEFGSSISDNQGGVWSTPFSIQQDAKGHVGLVYVLLEGSLSGNVRLDINQVEVCQFISDGPADVFVIGKLFGNFGSTKRLATSTVFSKNEFAFEYCKDSAGDLPILENRYKFFMANPYDAEVLVTVDRVPMILQPKQVLGLTGNFTPSQFTVTSSLPVPTVIWSDDEDLNLVGLPTKNHSDFIIPHLARNGGTWENHWIFANNGPTTLSWKRGDKNGSRVFSTGIHEYEFFGLEDNPSQWVRVHTSNPSNGFFRFTRSGVGGGAWVQGNRIDLDKGFGFKRLYLPHVARDTLNFWTGYSLANLSEDPATVTMTAYASQGQVMAVETFEVDGLKNEVGLVGTRRFVGVEDISWILIESDQPLSGIELIGSNFSEQRGFSGFLLPEKAEQRLSFPAIKSDGVHWSGLAVLNVADQAVSAQVDFYDDQGVWLGEERLNLSPREKRTWLVPDGVRHATCKGRNLVAFCLIGQRDLSKIGSYLGIAY